MLLKEISVTIGERINTGDYSSIGPSVTLTATLEGDEQISTVLQGSAHSALVRQAVEFYAEQALKQLAWAAARSGDGDALDRIKGVRAQVKSLL